MPKILLMYISLISPISPDFTTNWSSLDKRCRSKNARFQKCLQDRTKKLLKIKSIYFFIVEVVGVIRVVKGSRYQGPGWPGWSGYILGLIRPSNYLY